MLVALEPLELPVTTNSGSCHRAGWSTGPPSLIRAMSCDTWAPHLVVCYVIGVCAVSTLTDACSNSGPALGCARDRACLGPSHRPHPTVSVGHDLTADPVVGVG